MATISVCMIVKNEEANLSKCLLSLQDFADEIIIVDTGSSDSTVEIAKRFTDRIYNFEWVGDFAKARNYAFSKATMDYIYSADADEYIDEENRKKLLGLKSAIIPEVEIVQFIYHEPGISTVLNSSKELRPKLYKRNREFVWIDPVHETIRTLPVVFDSDIVIEHTPHELHADRDFKLIEDAYKKDGNLSPNLYEMYAKECYKWADADSLNRAADIFLSVMADGVLTDELYLKLAIVVARAARLRGDTKEFIKMTSKVLVESFCSEICCEMGDYFYEKKDYEEALLWYMNAIEETESILDIDASDKYPKDMIHRINKSAGIIE